MTTKELEIEVYYFLRKMGTYLCFEVMMPSGFCGGEGYNNERVDLLTYDTKKTWRFYELKISVSDFHSKAKKTFAGHYNYYVMPLAVYVKVKNEIPEDIGCIVVDDITKEWVSCWCIKKPKHKELAIVEEPLKFAFMQALSRQHHKLMKIRKEELRNKPCSSVTAKPKSIDI